MTRVCSAWALLVSAILAQGPVRLDLSLLSGGASTVSAAPGATITYELRGQLTNSQNQGLALFSIDLAFTGGPLMPADEPAVGPMLNFDRPLGLSNSDAFGGTPSSGTLIQVGGGQNTINNSFASVPIGPVVLGVASPGSPAVLLTGQLVAPMIPGAYTLAASNLFANVIAAGTTGFPVWKVAEGQAGTFTELTVVVGGLRSDVAVVSITSPSPVTFSIECGSANAGRVYWTLGSVNGTTPGFSILPGGLPVPLNLDWYTDYTVQSPNSVIMPNSMGQLGAMGTAMMTFELPANLPPGVVGAVLHHAVVLLNPIDFVTNAVAITLIP